MFVAVLLAPLSPVIRGGALAVEARLKGRRTFAALLVGTAAIMTVLLAQEQLRLEPNSRDFVRVTRWGDYSGYKASNPVVSPDGTTIAFQSARSSDPAGVGYGIFLLKAR